MVLQLEPTITGLLSTVIAAGAMTLTSVFVVGNAPLLRRVEPGRESLIVLERPTERGCDTKACVAAGEHGAAIELDAELLA